MKRLGGGERQRSQCPIPYEMEPWYALTLWTGRVTASSSSGSGCHTASCSEVLHWLAFSFALNWHCAENHCATTCHGVSLCVCVFLFLRRICFLLHASWWEVTWQTVPCDLSADGWSCAQPPLQEPARAQRTPFKEWKETSHTCTHERRLPPKSHNNRAARAIQVENYTGQSIANRKLFFREWPMKGSLRALPLKPQPIRC